MKRLALAVAALALSAPLAGAWGVPMSWICTDGYTWVEMVYAQPVGSQCAVRMPGGWIYYGWTV